MLLDAFWSEVLGTATLILLGAGVVANVVLPKNKGFGPDWLLISFGWGLAVFAGVYAAFKSGAHLNPAVTVGLWVAGEPFHDGGQVIEPTFSHAMVYFAGEFVGAFIGAVLAFLAYKKHFDQDATRPPSWACSRPGRPSAPTGGTSSPRSSPRSCWCSGWWRAVRRLAARPARRGLIVVAIGISLGGPTGYAINPARDLSPRIAHALLPIPGKGGSDWSYAWVPWRARSSAGSSPACSAGSGSPSPSPVPTTPSRPTCKEAPHA